MKKNSINQKLFFYLSGFVLFIAILLFILQTLALEAFYKIIKKNEAVKTAEYVINNYENYNENYNIEEYIHELFAFQNICIIIYDEQGNVLMKNFDKSYLLDKITKNDFKDLYEKTEKSPLKKQFSTRNRMHNHSNPNFRRPFDMNNQNEFLLYSQISDEKNIIVVIESMLSPVGATKNILKIQILYISLILILSATILAYILAKKISSPIIKINHSAKALTDGNYNLVLNKSDYNEVVELNDTLKEISVELKKADKMQKDLIANISHDLRTPLTMIIGYSEVMRDIPGENNSDNIQIIIDEATRLNNLVNDILSISKVQNDYTLNLKNTNITKLTQEIIDRAKKMTEKDDYNFEFLYDNEIFIPIDEIKISQVIYNLLGNAITHTGADNKISIIQQIINGKVRITVKDTGKGISKKELKNIWERYYKADDYHNRSTVGTGLGLSIVKNIINLHNGDCGVISKIGEGSSFWFELPL